MGSSLRIGVAGATGALGREVLAVLDEAPWRPDHVVALARVSTKDPTVAYGDDNLPVDVVDDVDLGSLDALIVALPREDAGAVVDRAGAAGVPVVDLSGSQVDQLDVPLLLPRLADDLLDAPRARDVVATPSAPATLIASILGPLAERGWGDGAQATVLLPASAWGRDAIDELSRQVVALFNQGAPPRSIFPMGLAFDVIPHVGTPTATGWTTDEIRVVAEVGRLVGARTAVTLVGVPVFSGLTATMTVPVPSDVELDEVVRVLQEAQVVVVPDADTRHLPRPRTLEGEPFAAVARVRREIGGTSVHLWAGLDNLRASAVVAVGVLARLIRQADDPSA